ncbi:MAG: cation:proton antiporter [Candidatus Cloacimonetes bacterium]|nr:cation:proton antiporter [Candidatus Cloacimonadota bacterium]MDD4156349.1 cation:proton antiporter [Candidatus Cloacimonadota bacterium]
MNTNILFIFIGITIIFSILLERGVARFKSPAILAYILAGAIIGPGALGLVQLQDIQVLNFINVLTLALIGFNVGSELRISELKKMGSSIITIVIFETLLTWLVVFLGTSIILKSIPMGIIYGALAAATAPAGTVDVIRQYKAQGKLTSTLFAVMGIDDILALIIFSISIPIARLLIVKGQFTLMNSLLHAGGEIVFSVGIGVLSGFILYYVARKIHNKNMMLLLSIGVLFFHCGIAEKFRLSPILINMSTAIVLVNKSAIISRKFSGVYTEWAPPIYLLFFALIGTRMNIFVIWNYIPIIVVYILTRTAGKFSGAYVGCSIAKSPKIIKTNLGYTLLSQAGVAIGLTYGAVKLLEEAKLFSCADQVINVMTSTTFLIMLIGPVLVKYGLNNAGEIKVNE